MLQNKRLIKIALIALSFFFISEMCHAKRCAGYIITNSNDTVFGEIKVYSANRNSLHLFSKSAMEWFFIETTFRKNSNEKYTLYYPDDILGYGFTYKGKRYTFRTFLIKAKSIVISEKEQKHFLQFLTRENGISLYRKQSYTTKYFNSGISLNKSLSPSYDYYVYEKNKGLQKIQHNRKSIIYNRNSSDD